jgi:hypothetical protein
MIRSAVLSSVAVLCLAAIAARAATDSQSLFDALANLPFEQNRVNAYFLGPSEYVRCRS